MLDMFKMRGNSTDTLLKRKMKGENMKTCSDCTLWVPEHGSATRGTCHLYPLVVSKRRYDWCGQHRGKAGRPAKSAEPLEKKA